MKQRMRQILAPVVMAAAATVHVSGCGGPGEAESEPCALCGDYNDLRGSVSAKNGNQVQMQGWAVVAFERDTGIARVGEVDAAGLYQLLHVNKNQSHTFALLTPDYILQAVLSIPGTVEKTIRQFVTVNTPYLPQLINNGPIISFQDYNGITVTRDVAADANGDLIPDGMVSLGAGQIGLNLQTSTAIDTDLDVTVNEKDPDIDGDGIINVIDPDDNGNAIFDVFDGDANGDLVNDTAPGENDTDLYFKTGVEFIAVQFEMKPKDDGTGNDTTLQFTTKVRDDVTPLAVQVRGAPSLLNSATYIANDTDGNPQVQAWNRLLVDDGLSNDGNPSDRRFAKRVTLADGKSPRAHEMVFFQLVFGTPEAPWFLEYPYIFPDLKPAAITAQYDTTTKSVLLIGNPFGGEIQDFIWTINVWDSEGAKSLWTSQAIPGTERRFAIQENIFETGKTYKFTVTAQTQDKIPGFPSYTIHSKKYDIK